MIPDVFEKFKGVLPSDCSVDFTPVFAGLSRKKHTVDAVIWHRNFLGEPYLVMLPEGGRDIEKGDVTKLWDAVRDIGFGKGLIVTKGNIAPDAAKAAYACGIILMDEGCVNRMRDGSVHYGLHRYMEPDVSHDEAKRVAERRAKKESGYWCIRVGRLRWKYIKGGRLSRFLRLRSAQGKPEWELVGFLMVYYPYYEVTMERTRGRKPNATSTRVTIVRHKVSLDARSRRLVFCDKQGISYRYGKNPAEVAVLHGAGDKITNKRRRGLALDPETISNTEDDLVHDGRLEASSGSRDYKIIYPVPKNLKPVTEHYGKYSRHPDGPVMDPTVSTKDAADMIGSQGGRVAQVDATFVPHHLMKYKVGKETITVVVRAVGKKLQPVPEILDETNRWLEEEEVVLEEIKHEDANQGER